ncbi:deaminase domain-containing protein [Xenorhabdus szentirmaii]|uniref:The BURPS668_1122 family of deaminases n=1 Tax=Xenorhabdus szentirmaii DSM 16338 TaxID=1427518 RepID=W1IVK2_9GAMM|nr:MULTISPECIES: deaminase domain-containing protein [Xenorhabdus]CDL81255.1 conserved hypothetical protein [Xenorhabdus szentirmaii DSM 16338]
MGGKPGGIGKKRNLATSNFDINVDGKPIKGIADAASGEGSVPGLVDVPNPNKRLFTTTVVTHPRAFDSEAKIFEHIASKINPNAKGTVNLYSELPICKSCQGVIKQFETMHPNVKVNIINK